VDGSVAAELSGWLSERELDIEETTLDNYRNLFRMYVIPHIGGRQLYATTSASCRTCTRRS
jgi:Phage integrase, N-terminal SAM-like domain